MNAINRLLQLPSGNSFFLFGPRQTGKSTLLRQTFSEKESLSYDLLQSETYNRLAARPELLRLEVEAVARKGNIKRILIDEVQRVPDLLNEVHYLIEKYPDIKFALSGSSARKLKRVHANMLAGRAWTLRLYPFTARELGDEFDLNRALRFGALPAVFLAENYSARSEFLRSYVDSYFRLDIHYVAHFRNLGAFLRFLPLVASENGAQINVLNLAREIAMPRDTVRNYYQILEDTLLGYFLLPFAKSVRKKISRHPKFYFFDCGVVSALQKKLSAPLIEESGEFGRAFEHFLINEIMRLNDYLRLDLDISFYRTESGVEVDCVIIHPNGKIRAVEIKSTKSPVPAHCSGLRSFQEAFPQAECILACRAPRPMQLGPFLALPWQDVIEKVSSLCI